MEIKVTIINVPMRISNALKNHQMDIIGFTLKSDPMNVELDFKKLPNKALEELFSSIYASKKTQEHYEQRTSTNSN